MLRLRKEITLGLIISLHIIGAIIVAATHEIVPFGEVVLYDILRAVALYIFVVGAVGFTSYALLQRK